MIVPVHNGARYLRSSLAALAASTLPRTQWECIVVSDASQDGSELLAALHADIVVRLQAAPRGPAYARNRGAEVAHGDILVFLDPNVAVHHDTLERLQEALLAAPEICAVYASYDSDPPAAGLVSQYVNLRWHHRLQGPRREVSSFWAGCGAVRRSQFIAVGMFDEWQFPRAQVEDVELGHRLRAHGHRIAVDSSVQVTCLQEWTLGQVVITELRDRWVPWLRSAARRSGERYYPWPFWSRADTIGTLGVATAVIGTIAWWLAADVSALGGAVAAGACGLFAHTGLLLWLARRRGIIFTIGVVPVHAVLLLANAVGFAAGVILAALVGEPRPDPIVEAFSEVGVTTWPPLPIRHEPVASAGQGQR